MGERRVGRSTRCVPARSAPRSERVRPPGVRVGHPVDAPDERPTINTIRRSFEPITSSVRKARSFAVEAARLTDGSELAERLALVVSELATNAVLHARTTYAVTVVRTGGRVRVSVHDDGGAARIEPVELNRADVTGRGLRIVAAVADEWGSERDSDGPGKRVWAELVVDTASNAASLRSR